MGVGAPSTRNNCKAATAKRDSLETIYMMAVLYERKALGRTRLPRGNKLHYIDNRMTDNQQLRKWQFSAWLWEAYFQYFLQERSHSLSEFDVIRKVVGVKTDGC